MTPFGLKLRQLRSQRGISQKQMASDLNVSAAYLSALEHGKKGVPSWQMLQRIIHYFNIIWDEAEELVGIAGLSRTKTTINTIGLTTKANIVANRIAAEIHQLNDDALGKILTILDDQSSKNEP
ncbi:MAG: helix-turn-helix domain-containing protein [Rhizobiales bacterium]|nr:helix-turn-helix domain-containing protein [Hyphomicrobiales bacterium]NRB15205.1 helix-turn-helix domain-containing protein [Hyphomicrobiales bacterium]